MDKSPEAFRTISEVADAMNLPQHVLRFWETRFPQVRPLKRAGGRRYYRPDDVERLRAIKRLLYEEGYTIKGVQKLFKDQGAQALVSAAFAPVPSPSAFAPAAFAPREAIAARDDPALQAPTDEEDEALLREPQRMAFAEGPTLSPRDIERLRETLADLRKAENLLLQARTAQG
jgi:DNA-binding transcriptional MerR regulator